SAHGTSSWASSGAAPERRRSAALQLLGAPCNGRDRTKEESEVFWKRCNTCKKEIGFGAMHYVCSVSTCHRKGTDFVFCSTECWDAHVPTFRHRDAWAEERRAPRTGEVTTAAPPPRVESAPPRPSFASERPATPPAAAPVRPPASQAAAPSAPASGPVPVLVLHDRSRIPREIL